jgi:hypothetical protein
VTPSLDVTLFGERDMDPRQYDWSCPNRAAMAIYDAWA